jgi:hypothetical protein
MIIHHRVLYLPSGKVPEGEARSDAYTRAYRYALTVKSGDLKAPLIVGSDNAAKQSFPFGSGDRVRQHFGSWAVATAAHVAQAGTTCFVPIPSSADGLATATTFRSYQMGQGALAQQPGATCVPLLRFKTAMTPAHKGGSRDFWTLVDNMVVVPQTCPKKIILIDDITTTGRHMEAAEMVLQEAGYEVVCGLVCGRTVDKQNESDPWRAGSFDSNPFDVLD